MIQLVVADRLKIIREGLKTLLKEETAIQWAGEGTTPVELHQVLTQQKADVVLMGLEEPQVDSVAVIREVVSEYPRIPVLAYQFSEQEQHLFAVLDAGATGYVIKNSDPEELRFAIRTVAQGVPYVCTKMVGSLLQRVKKRSPVINFPALDNENLSRRELEVLHWIAEGYTNAEIAEKLFTSKRTIETHRQHLLEKTNSVNTAALVRYALTRGIIQ